MKWFLAFLGGVLAAVVALFARRRPDFGEIEARREAELERIEDQFEERVRAADSAHAARISGEPTEADLDALIQEVLSDRG